MKFPLIDSKTTEVRNCSEITSQYFHPSLGLSHAISAARSMGERQNAEVISERFLSARRARLRRSRLLAGAAFLAISIPLFSWADQLDSPRGLAELIRSTGISRQDISVQTAEPASSRIEPLPSQSGLFGRLENGVSKIVDDQTTFYRQTTKQPSPAVRHTAIENDRNLSNQQYSWGNEVYTWAAPNLYHQPLYFEEVNLERYGNGVRRLLQAPVSAAHFFTNIAVLPYHVASQPPRNREYTLGHYRPGDCVPHRFHRVPFSVKGLAAQGAAAAGIILIP